MYDIQEIRKDFPILEREVYGRPLVYLDNGATTQKPRCVVEAMTDEYYNVNANVHRGVHFLSQQATELHEAARETVRRFLNARSPAEIVFTRGTTESINLVASCFGEAFMRKGDEVILSEMEHHSNIVSWQLLQARKGIKLRVVPINDRGELMLDEYERLFNDRTRIVSVTHVSNVLGTVNLLQCCKDAWYDADAKTWKEGKKYLQVSTDEVYGALGAEGYFMETTPLCPHSPYSASKASADMFVKAFHDTYGMPINITRCSNNYGPYQFPEKLIPLLINNAKHHKTLPVYGDGMQIRDWLYVMDHCKAIDMVANGGKDGEVYNVGGHNERPNIFIVKTVIEQLHDRLKDEGISEELIKHVADRLGHDRRYGIDPTKIKNDLGWYPETPFEKGIVLTIDWYLNHEEWMNHVTSGDYQNYYQDMYKNK